MCGIIGYLSNAPAAVDAFVGNRDRMSHRGPDDAGLWRNPASTVLLGHRRLAILDLTAAGHQPMASACGRFVIVFNGEIYNFLELRRELEVLGLAFTGHGDTEVVLAAYRHWGEGCLRRFNGMFAFAIWDGGTADTPPSLFLARDRAGKKPLYYAHRGRTLAFASELKSIPAEARGNIDIQALNHYLALGYVPGARCIAAGANKLPPAHAARFRPDTGEMKIWRWWDLPQATSGRPPRSGEELAEESWSLLADAVRLRLRSDVPVGIFLSGGLDSSLVTAAAAAVAGRPVNTFTVGLPGSKLDESHYAQTISDYFGTHHHLLALSAPTLDVLEELAPFVDEPLADSSILPTYLVSRLTAQHVKVVLGGDGGDELYGGYPYYQSALRDERRLAWFPKPVLRVAGRWAAQLPAGIRGRNRMASLRGGVGQAYAWGTPYFDVDLRRRILHPDVVKALGDDLTAPEAYLLQLMQQGCGTVDALTRADFHSILPDDFLFKVDRASMAHGLEVRAPFLDCRLIEHAFGVIPTEWKVSIGETRRIQKLMAKKYLPKDFKLDRKQGFSIPMDEWLREGSMGSRLERLPEALFSGHEIASLVHGEHKGRSNGARLFALMMLAISSRNLNATR